MSNILLIPAQLDSYRSLKDKSLKIVFETAEPTPEQLQTLQTCLQFPGFVAFNKDAFKKEQLEAIQNIKADYDDTSKSKGQRLRGVLFRLYEQDNKGYEVFDDYYNYMMEKIIIHYKNLIE